MIFDFDNLELSSVRYGGHAGSKLGVVINGENWFLKFPQSTKAFARKVDMSYSTAPLSEYIGSHVYELIDIPVHNTLLGVRDGRVVVACKDFTGDSSVCRLDDFNAISNDYVSGLDEKLSQATPPSSTHAQSINEMIIIMENNPAFFTVPVLKDRFWDMFVVDALIGNNDRNSGNWGILYNKLTGESAVAPVFDNGSSFNNNTSEKRIEHILSDKESFFQSAYATRQSFFLGKDGKKLNPFTYIESMENNDCNRALLRVVPNINTDDIREMIESIPREWNGIGVISDARKEFYCRCVEYRYEKSLYPCFLKTKELEQQGQLESDSFVRREDDDLEL